MPITFTLKRASEESGLAIRTLYNKIGSGELPSIKIGKRRLIPARALEDFLLRGGTSSAPTVDAAQGGKSPAPRKPGTARREAPRDLPRDR